MGRGIPLPANLSGNQETRLIEVDEALLYLVIGAVVELIDHTPLEQTGTLTVEDAKTELEGVLYALIT